MTRARMATPDPAIPTLRQRLVRAALLRRVSDAVPPTSYLTDLRHAVRGLPLKPTEQKDLLICLELDEPREDHLADPWAREDRFRLLLRQIDRRRTKQSLPRIAHFLDLVQQGYLHGLAHAMASDVRPHLLESLARQWETGDHTALSEALRLVDPDNAIEDPADITERWLRQAILQTARRHIPRTGKGRTQELTPETRRASKRAAKARSQALTRLERRYTVLVNDGAEPRDAYRQVIADFDDRARMKDLRQRALVKRAFRTRHRVKE